MSGQLFSKIFAVAIGVGMTQVAPLAVFAAEVERPEMDQVRAMDDPVGHDQREANEEKGEKAEHVAADVRRHGHERNERAERPERAERVERPERPERMERPERPEPMEHLERPERLEHSGKH